jgi:hypothetical protein
MPPSIYRTIEAASCAICIAGVGAVLGLAFVDPAGAAESAQIIADHGGLDWLIRTSVLLMYAAVVWRLIDATQDVKAFRKARRERREQCAVEFRDCEFIPADEDYANVTAERQEDTPVTVAIDWHFDIMCLMTIANRQRPYLASLFPSLFGEGA